MKGFYGVVRRIKYPTNARFELVNPSGMFATENAAIDYARERERIDSQAEMRVRYPGAVEVGYHVVLGIT